MTLAQAVKLLESKYEQAKNMEYVHKPLAWAAYQTWKEVDSGEHDKKREYNRIAQQKSRAKRKGGAEDARDFVPGQEGR